MTPEKLLDALAVEAELLFDCKEHLHQAEGQQAFSVGCGRAAAEVGGMGEEFQSARPALGAPEVSGVQKFLPLALAGLFQHLRRREALHKHPRTDLTPVLKGFQSGGIVLGQGMAQLIDEGGALLDEGDFIAA